MWPPVMGERQSHSTSSGQALHCVGIASLRVQVEMTIREGEFAGNMVMRRMKEQAE